ncbi:spore protease YyaC [Caldanaerobacter subterraneus KAk]|uniref:spore protease YyaC n=1 Tax=Caldanaerobacter subterraneus TaxID=911092 RepID=UPI0032C0A00F
MEFINIEDKNAFENFYRTFQLYFKNLYKEPYREIILLCIGTDRSTGDSLGPLTGHKLKPLLRNKAHVFGTLEDPLHAKNIIDVLKEIRNTFYMPFTIAIDASLGSLKHVGHISIGKGPIKPGAGVSKELPPVGDMFVTGIVNISGFMEYMVLQNTRLRTVMKMADIIAAGVFRTITEISEKSKVRA